MESSTEYWGDDPQVAFRLKLGVVEWLKPLKSLVSDHYSPDSGKREDLSQLEFQEKILRFLICNIFESSRDMYHKDSLKGLVHRLQDTVLWFESRSKEWKVLIQILP